MNAVVDKIPCASNVFFLCMYTLYDVSI